MEVTILDGVPDILRHIIKCIHELGLTVMLLEQQSLYSIFWSRGRRHDEHDDLRWCRGLLEGTLPIGAEGGREKVTVRVEVSR